jgi:signal peptidase II
LKEAVPLNRYVVFFALALGICAADLVSKSWMFARLGMPESPIWWIWDGEFGFGTSLNEGALFSIGWGLWPLFSALAAGAAIGIFIWLFPFGAAKDWLLTIALGLVTAGILGNLYDRLGLHGLVWPAGFGHQTGTTAHAVRDFIRVMIGNWQWPTFNLADSALVCGATLLAWHAIFTKAEEKAPKEE